MSKITKKHIPRYIEILRERINGPLFSNEQSPNIEDYVRLTPEREASIKTEKDLINLLEGLIEDTHNWMEAERLQTIRLECIREAAEQLGDRSLRRLWNDATLNIDDQDDLEQLINRKLRTSRGLIRSKRGTMATLTWVIFALGCAITAGLILIALTLILKKNPLIDLYQTIKKEAQPAKDFINADFDEEAAEELDRQLAPYVQAINAAKNQLLADRNKKSKKGNASQVPKNIYKTNFLGDFDKRDMQSMSVASRLLRDLIYTNPKTRYYHIPEAITTKRPGERSLIQWEDGTELIQRRNQITYNTSYFLKRPNETEKRITIKNGYGVAQVGKIDDNTFWMLFGSCNILIVDKRSGQTENILSKELHETLKQSNASIRVIKTKNSDVSGVWYVTSITGSQYYGYVFSSPAFSSPKIRAQISGDLNYLDPVIPNVPNKLIKDLPHFKNNPYFLKDGNIILQNNLGIISLYSSLESMERIFDLQLLGCIAFCVSHDDNIAVILYSNDSDTTYHIKIWDLKALKVLNEIEMDWPVDNESPNEIYFDDTQNICIQSETTVLTYPYGQQAQECEADRQENFLPFK